MSEENYCSEHFSSHINRNNYKKDHIQGIFRISRGGRSSPTHSAHGCLMRTSLQKLSQDKKAKKINVYKNGDRFFKGFVYALSFEKIRTFDALLEDLTRVLSDQVALPKGVRHIFALEGKEKIKSLEQLQDGGKYVCSSNDHFKRVDYEKGEKPQWMVSGKTDDIQPLMKTDSFTVAENGSKECKHLIRPKLITVIRNGIKPRKAVRILLNKKTAHSYEQVLSDITSAIKLDSGVVRKIFTLNGNQVSCLLDFFQEEDIFIAYGPEKFSRDDFDLDSEECKYLNGCSRTSTTTKKIQRSNPLSSCTFPRYYGSQESRNSLPGSPKISHRTYSETTSAIQKYQPNNVLPLSALPLPYEIIKQYDVGKGIGDGNFAVVKECIERATKQEYALKIIDKTKCRGKEHMIASEVGILRQVKHPNIVQLLKEFDFETELYLVMELVKGGDLFDAISSATKYTEQDASGMVQNLASALSYLHCLNIVHRDIKPENLLVADSDGRKILKLGDFGLAVEVKGPLYTVCGTPTYVAPEILAETGYGLKVDIWAAGVIAYILLCGFPPFVSQNNNQEELFKHILIGKFEFTSPYWDEISDSAQDLISHMLEINPEFRYSADQVLRHGWVADDSAPGNGLLSAVSQKLTIHFEHNLKPSLRSAGAALIARTSLDKESNYFHNYHNSSQHSVPLQPFYSQNEEKNDF